MAKTVIDITARYKSPDSSCTSETLKFNLSCVQRGCNRKSRSSFKPRFMKHKLSKKAYGPKFLLNIVLPIPTQRLFAVIMYIASRCLWWLRQQRKYVYCQCVSDGGVYIVACNPSVMAYKGVYVPLYFMKISSQRFIVIFYFFLTTSTFPSHMLVLVRP